MVEKYMVIMIVYMHQFKIINLNKLTKFDRSKDRRRGMLRFGPSRNEASEVANIRKKLRSWFRGT